MIPTITDYRPGIYAELLRRADARAAREERLIRLLHCASDTILAALAVAWLAFVGWLLLTLTFS